MSNSISSTGNYRKREKKGINWIFNSKDLVTEVEIKLDCASCLDTFVKGAKTLIFAHGFSGSYDSGTGVELRESIRRTKKIKYKKKNYFIN
jgi:hypothetical protein